MDPAFWLESLGLSEPGALGGWVVSIVTLSFISFPCFCGFSWCCWSRGQVFDFSMNMRDRRCWIQNIGWKNWRYQRRARQGQGVVDCNITNNFIFLLFMDFHCVDRVGGEFAFSQ